MRRPKNYKLTSPNREMIAELLKIAKFANSKECGRWAWQSSSEEHDGVYGCMSRGIQFIVREEFRGVKNLPAVFHELCMCEFCSIVTDFSIEEFESAIQAALDAVYEAAEIADSIT